jgi:histidinol-phosphatase
VSGPAWGPDWSASLRRGHDRELRGWLELARRACDDADDIALRHFRREVAVTQKPDRTLVSEVDQDIERLLRERIQAAYPDHGVLGEEYGRDAEGASVRWYVDPIDGTHNYLRGIPIFGTLIAVERDGEIQVGVISAPALGARWHAWRGGGAWGSTTGSSEVRRLRASRIASLADAQVCYGSGPEIAASGSAPGFGAVLAAAWRTRGFGDFWGYALVAEGAAEAMIEVDLSPWDVAAPLVLVEEAGGRLTDLAGGRSVTARDYLASNGWLHDEIRARLTAAPPVG